jgi:iron complex outermembrane recepter protein
MCSTHFEIVRFTFALLILGVASAHAGAAAFIEEVVVTAQKRETALQETPIAITAFTADQLERDQIRDFRDVAVQTPSMTFTQLAGYTQIAMRGVGLDLTNLSAETSVALYEDGVYRGASFLQGIPSFDMERIEILRGPQGTLYGRNATAGAANIITKQPLETTEFNAAVTAGDYDLRRGELGFAGPLAPGIVSGRASFVYEDRGGYRRNVTLGRREDDAEMAGARGSLFFNVSEDLELVLRADYVKHENSGGLLINLQEAPTPAGISPANIGGFLTFPNPDLGGASLADVFGLTFPQATQPIVVNPHDRRHRMDQAASREVTQKGYSATLTWDVGDVTAKLIGAYRDNEMTFIADSDGTDVLMLTNDALQTNEQTTFELNVSGVAWDARVDWLLGAYYFNDDGFARFFYDLDALQTTFEAIFGIFGPGGAPLPPGSLEFFGSRLKTGQGRAAPFLDFAIEQESESVAYFGQATIGLTDDLRVTLGARHTNDDKKVSRQLTNNLGGAPCDSADDQSWNETTGTLILDYNVADDTLLYASVSRGYKAGGFNPGECEGAFDPETLLAYEGGIKTTIADGRVRLNGAVFLYDYDDIQVNRFVNNASVISNAAVAEIVGAELEFIVVAGAGFSFDGGVTWLDTEYSGGATFSDPIAGGPLINVDGNALLRSPEWKLYLGGQYGWETTIGRFLARLDFAYSDSFFFDVFEASLPNQSEMKQPSYTITNARVSWESLDGRYLVQGFVENIGDNQYAESRQAIGTTGAVIGEFSPPRRFGVRLAARLGE